MTLEEQQLISRVFDRMRSVPPVAKDINAERLIQQNIDRMPDAPYRLVQSVLIQEQALQRLTDRLQHLEEPIANAQTAYRATESSSSFLSGYHVPSTALAGSVPAVAPASVEPARQIEDRPAAPVASRTGGLLASALTTASGVAGGILLTDSLREMFGGRSSVGVTERSTSHADDLPALDHSQDDAQDAGLDAEEARRQLAEDDEALDETQDSLESSGGDAG